RENLLSSRHSFWRKESRLSCRFDVRAPEPPSLRRPRLWRHGGSALVSAMSIETASMQLFGSEGTPEGAQRGGPCAGLVLLDAPGFERMQPAYLVSSREVTIGRDATQSDIVVPEQAVSRAHAKIVYRGQSWVLSDLR